MIFPLATCASFSDLQSPKSSKTWHSSEHFTHSEKEGDFETLTEHFMVLCSNIKEITFLVLTEVIHHMLKLCKQSISDHLKKEIQSHMTLYSCSSKVALEYIQFNS